MFAFIPERALEPQHQECRDLQPEGLANRTALRPRPDRLLAFGTLWVSLVHQ